MDNHGIFTHGILHRNKNQTKTPMIICNNVMNLTRITGSKKKQSSKEGMWYDSPYIKVKLGKL